MVIIKVLNNRVKVELELLNRLVKCLHLVLQLSKDSSGHNLVAFLVPLEQQTRESLEDFLGLRIEEAYFSNYRELDAGVLAVLRKLQISLLFHVYKEVAYHLVELDYFSGEVFGEGLEHLQTHFWTLVADSVLFKNFD